MIVHTISMSSIKPLKVPKQKRLRAHTPKVRTGCITCKTRRVKCDETKPICIRCQKFGDGCGYATPIRRSDKHLDAIQPRISASDEKDRFQLQGFANIYPRISPLSTRNPSAAVPGDIVERRYFELFREELVYILCGYFHTPFWTRTIPQVCHHDPAIRHGVVALSALYKSSSTGDVTKGSPETHRTFAFLQFSKALKSLRESISNGIRDTRFPVMASLIFGSFESLHGQWETAIQQLSSARNLLKIPLVHDGMKTAPTIDPDLPPALGRLHLVLLSFFVLNPVYEFTTEDDGMDFEELMKEIPHQLETLQHGFPLIIKNAIFALTNVRRAIRFTTSPESTMSSETSARKREQLEKDFEPWHKLYGLCSKTFERILSDQNPKVMSKEYLGALTLHLQGETFNTMVATCLDPKETAIDSFLEHFRYIVISSRFLIETEQKYWEKGEPALKFGLGLTLCLYYTATRCRDTTVRREAIAILQQFPLRSGLWDSHQVAKVGAWVADLEDEGRNAEGFVAENLRVRMHTLKWTVKDEFVNVECMQGQVGGSLKSQRAALPR